MAEAGAWPSIRAHGLESAATLVARLDREAFYRMLNGRVYLWPTRRRVEGLLGARAHRGRPHLVLEPDTAALLARHGDRVRLSPITIGATLINPPPRGPDTAAPLSGYPWTERRRAVAEVSVEGAVPDAVELVVDATVHHPDGRRTSV